MILTVENLDRIMHACLFTPEEVPDGFIPDDAVKVEGVVRPYAFHPGRLEDNRDNIRALLAELPETFRANVGGGWSFLQACMDQHGTHWGEHVHVEALLVLGLATKQASYLVPRDMWPILPGGMPYFVVMVD